MEKIPTADEFKNKFEFYEKYGDRELRWDSVENYAIEFAKMHVKAALEAAKKDAKLRHQSGYGTVEHWGTVDYKEVKEFSRTVYGHGDSGYDILTVSNESILNAYPETNIK